MKLFVIHPNRPPIGLNGFCGVMEVFESHTEVLGAYKLLIAVSRAGVGNGVVGDGVERIHHVRYDEVAEVAVACGA